MEMHAEENETKAQMTVVVIAPFSLSLLCPHTLFSPTIPLSCDRKSTTLLRLIIPSPTFAQGLCPLPSRNYPYS